MKRRETRPPIECATRCTGLAGAERLDLPVESGSTLVDVLAPVEAGTAARASGCRAPGAAGGRSCGGRPPGGRGRRRRGGSPSAFSSRSPIRPAIRRTKLIQIRSESPLRSTESSSVPMIPGRHEDLAELAAARDRARRRCARARTPPAPSPARAVAAPRRRARRSIRRTAVEVAAVERSLERLEPRRLGRVTTSVPRREGTRARGCARRCVRPVRRSIGVRR